MSSNDSGWNNGGWNTSDWNKRGQGQGAPRAPGTPGGAQNYNNNAQNWNQPRPANGGRNQPRPQAQPARNQGWDRTQPSGGQARQTTRPGGSAQGWNRPQSPGNTAGWNRTQPPGNTAGWNRQQPPGNTPGWNNGAGGGSSGTENEVLSWVVIGLCFVLFWPLGLFLLIRKLSDGKSTTNRVSNSRSSAAQVQRQMQDRARRSQTRQQAQQAQAVQRPAARSAVPPGWAAPGQAAAAQQQTFTQRVVKPPSMKKGTRLALKIIGGILAVGGSMATLGVLSLTALPLTMWYLVQLLQTLAIAGAGGLMLGKGLSMDRAARRYQNYLAVMGNVQSISFAQLASITGYPERKVVNDLDRMIARNYFGPTAYLDQSLGYFFRSRTAAEEAEAEKRAAAATPKEAEEGYTGVLRSIRRANDRIADPSLSRKINRLEEVTAQIFRAIEKDEQKAAQMHTFLEYYLPTTQKLLDSYAEFEAAGVDGENLRMAKEKIEETMDNIIRGFEHQLDALYAADAMDIQADIHVMNNMMQRDQAMHSSDFKVSPAPGTAGGGPRLTLTPDEDEDGDGEHGTATMLWKE